MGRGMARGGIAARFAQQAKIEKAAKYRLVGVAAGSRVSECLDKYGRWELGYRTGTILRNTVTSVTVKWDGEDEFTYYTAGDARYEVDRDRWHIIPPKPGSVLGMTSKTHDSEPMLSPVKIADSTALTKKLSDGKISISPKSGEPPLTEEEPMATGRSTTRGAAKKAAATSKPSTRKPAGKATHKVVKDDDGHPQAVPVDDEDEVDDELDDDTPEVDEIAVGDVGYIDDEEDDEENDTPAPAPAPKAAAKKADGPVERETYTAKQVATRIGTDAKTLRKFFRSTASTVEPVGQGGRYEFDAADLPKIRDEFTKWNSGKTTRTPGEKKAKAPRGSRQAPPSATVIEEDDEVLELDDEDEEPTDDELAEIDDELDDEDED